MAALKETIKVREQAEQGAGCLRSVCKVPVDTKKGGKTYAFLLSAGLKLVHANAGTLARLLRQQFFLRQVRVVVLDRIYFFIRSHGPFVPAVVKIVDVFPTHSVSHEPGQA